MQTVTERSPPTSGRTVSRWVRPIAGHGSGATRHPTRLPELVGAGTLDDMCWLRPTVHFWTRSALPRFALPEAIREVRGPAGGSRPDPSRLRKSSIQVQIRLSPGASRANFHPNSARVKANTSVLGVVLTLDPSAAVPGDRVISLQRFEQAEIGFAGGGD